MNLIQFLAMKLRQAQVNSAEVLVLSKTNFVKVVQNQLLFRKPLMLCTNWYCKIVMWPIVRLRQPYSLVGPAYIQYCMNNWLSKKFVCVGKRLVSIGRKKCSKNTITVLRNTSMTSWQVMNHGFTRMSPKVNSSWL